MYYNRMYGIFQVQVRADYLCISSIEAVGLLLNSLQWPAGGLGNEFAGIILLAMLTAGLSASVGFFQELFSDSNRTGANLDKLVLLDVLQGHLKTHYSCRPDFGGVVLA